MTEAKDKTLCVAVYSPMVGGLYYSELITQIMQLCEIKRYKIKVIRTGGYGDYNSRFALDDVDIIVLLRNAVHANWVRDVRSAGKAVVSVSYDYFPLDVPVVVSDHAYGIKLALDDLRDEGCNKFAFVGNLNNYDIRKRYEAFCDYAEDEHLTLAKIGLYSVNEDLLGGGYQAALEYIRLKGDANGLVFGTTMNAIGFCNYIKDVDTELLDSLSITGFDANSMVPVLQPNIAAVDQNYSLVAYKVITIGEKLALGESVEPKHLIQPKLISRESETYDNADAYMATSYELAELYDPNYMKCVTYNMHEWTESIARTNLDDIMILRPMFKGDLELVSFGRFVNAGIEKKLYKTLKIIVPDNVIQCTPQDKKSLCKEERFPIDTPEVEYSKHNKSLHLMINKDGEHWGVLSVFGSISRGGAKSSYLTLSMYLEWILVYLKPKSSSQVPSVVKRTEDEKSQKANNIVEGKVHWDMEKNEFKWEQEALSMLGFESDLDKGVYSSMELADRLKESDVFSLRQFMETLGEDSLSLSVHFRHKNRTYITCDIISKRNEGSRNLEFILRST